MQPTIYAVGFGPGDVLHMTTQAVSVLETVDVIVGYTTYIQLLQEQFPDKQFCSRLTAASWQFRLHWRGKPLHWFPVGTVAFTA